MPYTPNYAPGDILSASAMNSIGEAWNTFTPTWSASVGAPTIGNGTIAAQYCQINKVVHAHYRLTFGSTSTVGSGTWRLSLPVTAKRSTDVVGTGYCADGLIIYGCFAVLQSTTTVQLFTMKLDLSFTYELVQPAAPFAWSTNDVLEFSITYEAA